MSRTIVVGDVHGCAEELAALLTRVDLGADDDLVMAMRKQCDCKIALFSLDETNRLIRQHCKLGGLAAIYENGFITISKGEWKLRIEKAQNVPLTYGGKAVFNIQNVLPAVLAAFVRGERERYDAYHAEW